MKFYFAGSISSGRQDVGIYHQIISILKEYGQVLTEFIGNSDLSELGEDGFSDHEIHNRDINWLMNADVLVAEVTNPSLGVGYEIGRAIENNKEILCFYRKLEGKRLSAMIKGAPGVLVHEYSEIEDIQKVIELYISKRM